MANRTRYKYWHANSGIFERDEAKQTTWSERTTRHTHEIRQQRVSRTISPLEAHRSPFTVGASMSHSSSAVLLQHNTICIRRKSRRNLQLLNTTTPVNNTAMASADCSRPTGTRVCRPAGPAFQPIPKQPLRATVCGPGCRE